MPQGFDTLGTAAFDLSAFLRNLYTLSTGMFPRSLGLRGADTHWVPLAQLLPPRPVLDLQVHFNAPPPPLFHI